MARLTFLWASTALEQQTVLSEDRTAWPAWIEEAAASVLPRGSRDTPEILDKYSSYKVRFGSHCFYSRSAGNLGAGHSAM